MLMPQSREIPCPQCVKPLQLTVQAEIWARGKGTAINCHSCHSSWLLRLTPEIVFSPMSTLRIPGRRTRVTE